MPLQQDVRPDPPPRCAAPALRTSGDVGVARGHYWGQLSRGRATTRPIATTARQEGVESPKLSEPLVTRRGGGLRHPRLPSQPCPPVCRAPSPQRHIRSPNWQLKIAEAPPSPLTRGSGSPGQPGGTDPKEAGREGARTIHKEQGKSGPLGPGPRTLRGGGCRRGDAEAEKRFRWGPSGPVEEAAASAAAVRTKQGLIAAAVGRHMQKSARRPSGSGGGSAGRRRPRRQPSWRQQRARTARTAPARRCVWFALVGCRGPGNRLCTLNLACRRL